MVEKIKTEVDRLLLVQKIQKSLFPAQFIGENVIIVKTKSSPSTSIFIFSMISQILIDIQYIY